MSFIFGLQNELISTLSRVITGSLFTEKQIKGITIGVVGNYFGDFFPTPKSEQEAQYKVNKAQEHIAAASNIILEMQKNLDSQNKNLDQLLIEIEEKKKLAERYTELTKTDKKKLTAFREEMEDSLRKELNEQAAKGRRLRQIISFLIWLITLVAGAALGVYFTDIVRWFKGGSV